MKNKYLEAIEGERSILRKLECESLWVRDRKRASLWERQREFRTERKIEGESEWVIERESVWERERDKDKARERERERERVNSFHDGHNQGSRIMSTTPIIKLFVQPSPTLNKNWAVPSEIEWINKDVSNYLNNPINEFFIGSGWALLRNSKCYQLYVAVLVLVKISRC